jgi:hypothetical protein
MCANEPGYTGAMTPVGAGEEAAFRRFVDQYRARCLWFLRPDYYPDTLAECARVLTLIERHGDHEALHRAAEFRRWLSLPSNETSAAS